MIAHHTTCSVSCATTKSECHKIMLLSIKINCNKMHNRLHQIMLLCALNEDDGIFSCSKCAEKFAGLARSARLANGKWRTWSRKEYNRRPKSAWEESKLRSQSLYEWGVENNLCREVAATKKSSAGGKARAKKRRSSYSKTPASRKRRSSKKSAKKRGGNPPTGEEILQKLSEVSAMVRAFVDTCGGNRNVPASASATTSDTVDLITP